MSGFRPAVSTPATKGPGLPVKASMKKAGRRILQQQPLEGRFAAVMPCSSVHVHPTEAPHVQRVDIPLDGQLPREKLAAVR